MAFLHANKNEISGRQVWTGSVLLATVLMDMIMGRKNDDRYYNGADDMLNFDTTTAISFSNKRFVPLTFQRERFLLRENKRRILGFTLSCDIRKKRDSPTDKPFVLSTPCQMGYPKIMIFAKRSE
jgi:hypothetical protein